LWLWVLKSFYRQGFWSTEFSEAQMVSTNWVGWTWRLQHLGFRVLG
jgi:hypothetical protein